MRIDDRFIHGQVGVTWISYVGAREIVLINDRLAADELGSMMQKMSAPTSKVTIKAVDDGISYLKKKNEKQLESAFVIVSCPQDALRLLDGGIQVSHINIGHTAHRDDTEEVHPYLFLGREELAAFQELERRGIDLDFRLIPSHKKPDLKFSNIKLKGGEGVC